MCGAIESAERNAQPGCWQEETGSEGERAEKIKWSGKDLAGTGQLHDSFIRSRYQPFVDYPQELGMVMVRHFVAPSPISRRWSELTLVIFGIRHVDDRMNATTG